MSEHAQRALSMPRPVGPGLRAAWRVVQAAELAAGAGHTQLTWTSLRSWPAWVGPEPLPLSWLRAWGACWHAAELQQCIDGARLNTLCDDLGAQTLQSVLQLDTAASTGAASPPPLPPSGDAADWRDVLAADGRSVALASVADLALRTAVATALGWSEAAAPVGEALAQRWMAVAQPARA